LIGGEKSPQFSGEKSGNAGKRGVATELATSSKERKNAAI
jgi:hypothetical protein